MQDEIEKLPPYKRLQEIFNQGEDPKLTKHGKSIIDDLIGKEPELPKSMWDKFIGIFKSIDDKLFPKGPKITNIYHRRK